VQASETIETHMTPPERRRKTSNCLKTAHIYPHPSKNPLTPLHSLVIMANPKNLQKGGHTGLHNGPNTKDGNGDKSRTREKYRSLIPKQANQTQSRTQLTEAQKAQGTGNTCQEGGTLPDPEIT